MHPIDRAASVLMRLDRRRLGVFPGGWGDRLSLELFDRLPSPEDAIADIDIVWGRKEEHPGLRVRRGSFTSPVAELLSAEGRVVPLEFLEPAVGAERTVILLPAWNDHGFDTRRKLGRLLTDRGIAVVSFDIPFYGGRRVLPEPAQAIRTVADFAVMGLGALTEARALLAHFAKDSHVGVSGYSMGGNLAALVSAGYPYELATAPLAASHSPGPVYLDGVLSAAIDWSALGGRSSAEELRGLLGAATALSTPSLPHHRAAVLVAATRDGFVPTEATRRLHEHWEGSELRMIDAGHATLISRHRGALADAVAASFDRLVGR
jgi:dienelactone hydrolase